VTIGEQQRQCIPSSVSVRLDPSLGLFEGTTENVALLALERSPLMRADTVIINLDSSKVVVASPPEQIWLERGLEGWHQGGPPSPLRKGPRRYGTFKDGFRNRVIFVYGSTGSREENEWAFAKARFDAECFWYQGNGSVEVISDKEFRPAAYPDNNVILYGNSRSNRAWRALLGLSPLQVSPGTVTLGGKTFRGDDLACLFIRPRPDSETASVAAVAGTGIRGMRLSNTRPYLFSGYALPDVVIVDSRVEQGDAAGLLAAGFFGLDWSVEGGEFAW